MASTERFWPKVVQSFCSRYDMSAVDIQQLWLDGGLPEEEIFRPVTGVAHRSSAFFNGVDRIKEFAAELQRRLPDRCRADLDWYCSQGIRESWCSLCAGTDSPTIGIGSVRDAVEQRTQVPWRIKQTYAVEIKEKKRLFFSLAYPSDVGVIFSDESGRQSLR